MYETEETRPRALAVALDTGAYDAEASLHELAQLADTAGIEVICTAVQKKDTPDNATFVGPGKLREIAQLCQDEEIDVLLFDDELSPMQIRNIEQVAGLAPVDRTMLILDIFAPVSYTHLVWLVVREPGNPPVSGCWQAGTNGFQTI